MLCLVRPSVRYPSTSKDRMSYGGCYILSCIYVGVVYVSARYTTKDSLALAISFVRVTTLGTTHTGICRIDCDYFDWSRGVGSLIG